MLARGSRLVALLLRSRLSGDPSEVSKFLGESFAVKAQEELARTRWISRIAVESPVIGNVGSIAFVSTTHSGWYALRARNVTTAAAATTTTQQAGEESKKWKFSMIFLFLPCLTTFGLGTWQLARRKTKIEMLEFKRKRLEEEPVPLAEIIAKESTGARDEELEYRQVMCEGLYDGSKSLYVGPRARSAFGVTQKGYYLITPLIGGHGDNSVQVPVLVNRGWVPSGHFDESPNKATTVEITPTPDTESSKVDGGPWWKPWHKSKNENKQNAGVASSIGQATMKVCGVIRGSEQPNMFVPSNVPQSGQWFYVDVPAMARAVGLPEHTILVEAVQDKGNSNTTDKYPIPKDPEALLHCSVMPQDHINYALTWYTLSAATTYMAVKRVRNARKGF